MKSYDFVVSIGEACFVSVELIDCNLQRIEEKFPLDQTRGIMWDKCGRGGLAGNVRLICNGFRDFLNEKDLEERGIDHTTHKRWVVNKETGMSFRHDFPIDTPLAESYPAILRKYKERIISFYQKICHSERVLFVYMSQLEGFPDALLLEQQQKLQERFPKQEVDMLYIMQKSGFAPSEYEERQLSAHVLRIDMDVKYTPSKDSAYIYRGNRDTYKQFLDRIKYTQKEYIILRNEITRLKWNLSGLSRSAHHRLSQLEASVIKLENYSKDAADKEREREEARCLLFVASNINHLRFKMYHLIIKKWLHFGSKRREYAARYRKTQALYKNAKGLLKKISQGIVCNASDH